MAEATLSDLVQEVKRNNKSQEETTGAVQSLTDLFVSRFKKEDYSAYDKLQGAKVAQPAPQRGSSEPNIALPGEGMFSGLLLTVGRLASLAAGLTASLAAVVGAFNGLRGWELKAIANLDKIGSNLKTLIPDSIGKNIAQAVMNLRASILRRFGINPALPTEFDEATKKKIQIRNPGALIADTFSKLSQNILAKFGIGADGKLIALKDAEGNFKSPKFGRLIIQVKSFFRPFFALTEGIGNFFKSDFFTKITGFIGGGAKAVARVFQKILWPIGFLFSTFDGVKAYIKSDADGFIARLGDGIGAFLGDFIGAPFDLLKKGISWIMTNWMGFEEGGKVMTLINGFSFEETIGGIVSGLFGLVQSAVDWVGTLFTDPTAAIEQLWTTYIGVWNGFGDFIWTKAVKPAFEWVNSLFGFDDTSLPTWEGLTSSVSNLGTRLSNIITALGDNLGLIKDILATEITYQITRVVNGFKIAFEKISTFIANLGDNLYVMLSNSLQFNFPGVNAQFPDWVPFVGGQIKEIVPPFSLGMGNEATRAAANERIDYRNAKSIGRVNEINNETAEAFANVSALQRQFAANMAPVVINQVDNSNNSTNTSSTSSVVSTAPTQDQFQLDAPAF